MCIYKSINIIKLFDLIGVFVMGKKIKKNILSFYLCISIRFDSIRFGTNGQVLVLISISFYLCDEFNIYCRDRKNNVC